MTAENLRGRTALVTGGSRGIGAAISKALAEAGAVVAINYRERDDAAKQLADILRKTGVHAITVPADVSQTDAVAKMVQIVKSERGAVDILINNAGIAITRGIDDLSEADFDRTISVNLKSVFLWAVQTSHAEG
jgi:3-oxoacyl-[acyl-carrier protein] reductase